MADNPNTSFARLSLKSALSPSQLEKCHVMSARSVHVSQCQPSTASTRQPSLLRQWRGPPLMLKPHSQNCSNIAPPNYQVKRCRAAGHNKGWKARTTINTQWLRSVAATAGFHPLKSPSSAHFSPAKAQRVRERDLNPFTVPACKISRVKVHGYPCKQSISWLYITSTLAMLCVLMKILSVTCRIEKR